MKTLGELEGCNGCEAAAVCHTCQCPPGTTCENQTAVFDIACNVTAEGLSRASLIGQRCEARWPFSAPSPIPYGSFYPAQIVDVRAEEPRYSVEWIGDEAGSFPVRSAMLSRDVKLLSNTSYIFATGPDIEADGTLVFELAERASGVAACSVGMRDSGAADGSSLQAVSGRLLLDIRIIPKNDPPSFQLLRTEIFLIEDEGLREMRVAHSIFADGVEGFTELQQVLI